MNFADLGLSEQVIRAINEFGLQEPTTVQADVIPAILEGRDVFTIAPQGCGKTMSYVLPVLDIISRKKAQTILIITPNSDCSVTTSDLLALFNKYHEPDMEDGEENISNEANVIIGSPDLLIEVAANGKTDLSKTDILVVDDINLIKKNKQLDNLVKILDMLPATKQNIVYTNRRSRETQDVLERILKAPEEIKVDKNKEAEAQMSARHVNIKRDDRCEEHRVFAATDQEAVNLAAQYKSFNGKVPAFLLVQGLLAEEDKRAETV